jgi:hypothetical protein
MTSKKITIMTLLLNLILSNSLFAQKYSNISEQKEKLPISIFGNFIFQGIYPGFRVGIEQPLKFKNYKDDSGKILKYKQHAVQYSFGFYYHGGFHTNFFATSEYVFRRISKKGFIREFKPGLSLSRTFIGATTYQVDNSGNVDKVSGAGDFYFMPSLNFGLGKDLGINKPSVPLAITANFNLTGILPYNGLVLPTPMFEIGFRYKLNGVKIQSTIIDKQRKSK